MALHLDEALAAATLEGGADESCEERVRAVRPGEELGVRLRRDVLRVHLARQLDELDEGAVR